MASANPVESPAPNPALATFVGSIGVSYSLSRRQLAWGLLLLSPWIIGFLLFYLLPMTASFIFTFTNFDLSRPNQIAYIGLQNWQELLRDPYVGLSLRNTLVYALIALPFSVGIPIVLAALLSAERLWGKAIFRVLFYMPFMIPTVAATFIWAGFLNPDNGWLNLALAGIGITAPNWMFDPNWIYSGLFLISLWGVGNAVIITLAGMNGVPTELYEAARVDGASGWVSFFKITLPMISPVIFYNMVLTVIAVFRFFDVPYMLKGSTGNPANSTLFYNIYLYRVAFPQQEMGYGSTMAWLLFALALGFTLILFATARRWVYYASGD